MEDNSSQNLYKIFPILNNPQSYAEPVREVSNQDIEDLVTELRNMDILDVVSDMVDIEVGKILRHIVAPTFWNHFKEHNLDRDLGFQKFQMAVEKLNQEFHAILEIMVRLNRFKELGDLKKSPQSEVDALVMSFRCTLLSQLPVGFEKVVNSFYSKSFCVFAGLVEGKMKFLLYLKNLV